MQNLAQYPYLIMAPDYSEASAGKQVLHYFCEIINNSGGKAWIVGGKVNPQWNTPRLTEEEYAALQQSDAPWIAVYPEVVSGNPLRAPVVVRYMLNREGVMNGNRLDHSVHDLFFWYRMEFAEKEFEPDLLNFENYDLELFQNDNAVKDLDLLYINRLPEEVVDYDKLPKNLTVLSMKKPLSLPELAKVLKRGRVLYTYEASGTCLLANLCGCPVVGLTAPGYESYALTEATLRENGYAGYTLTNTEEAIQKTRETLHKPREQLLLRREKSHLQFTHFITKTQGKAQAIADANVSSTFAGWLENRHTAAAAQAEDRPAILFVILNKQGDRAAVDRTVNALRAQLPQLPGSRMLIVQDGEERDDYNEAIQIIDFHHYQHHFIRLLQSASVEWVQTVPAGTTFAPHSLVALSAALQNQHGIHALYTDEAVSHAGTLTHFFKPPFNRDLFLGAPSLYLKRLFVRASSWLASGVAESGEPELELILKLIQHHGFTCVGHYPDIVTVVEQHSLTAVSTDEEGALIGHFAAQRQLPVEYVERYNGSAWRVRYALDDRARVTIILTHNRDANLMTRCIASLMDHTASPDIEILIPVISDTETMVLQTAREVEKLLPGKVRVLELPVCSEVQAVNIAAAGASGDALLLLDVSSVFVMRNWLSSLLNPLVRPEVACVGPKIINFDKKVMSAGMIAGADGWIANVGTGADWQAPGYHGRYQCEQNYTLLNSQCLLIKRESFARSGGLDERYAFLVTGVAAFCLHLHTLGYLAVWSPESIVATDNTDVSNNARVAEGSALIESYHQLFACDPAYGRHLSLKTPLYTLDEELTQNSIIASPKGDPVVLIVRAAQSAVAQKAEGYFRAMQSGGHIRLIIKESVPTLTAILRMNPAITVVNGAVSEEALTTFSRLRGLTGKPVYALLDESAEPFMSRPSLPFDRWLALTPALEKWGQSKGLEVLRIPDYVLQNWMAKETPAAVNDRCRVVCPLFSLTAKERDVVYQIIEQTYQSVDWYIFGECPASWNPLVKATFNYHANSFSIDTLDAVNPDAVVLFRDNNHQHRFADGYILLQYAARNISVICSDFACFAEYDFATKLKPRLAFWTDAIERLAATREQNRQERREMMQLLSDRYLFDDARQKALLTMLG
ncbi:hypothetical protein BFG07_14830 [Kosakonia cowanii]|nr:hypothetical protein BFG07_14830 [Kosakonia cowanii]